MERLVSLQTISLIMALSLPLPAVLGQVHVLTHHNDNQRTGANLNETALNTSNVNRNQFGKLFARVVDGQIYAQPLYVSNVTLPDYGTRNVVYVATQHNSVYAFDADDPSAAQPLWQVNLGPSVVVPNDEFGNRYGPYHDLIPELGITGTPVIDLGTQAIYVVSFTKVFTTYFQQLHALDITTGKEKFGGPVILSGSVPSVGGEDIVDGRVTFKPMQALHRGTLLANGVVYLSIASHADTRPYHGWILAYDAQTLQPVGVHNVTPNGREGGIWQSNQGPAADADGNIYFMTGNGSFNAQTGGPNYGNSFVKLSLSEGGLTVADWFTPCNQCCRDRDDADLGSAGPMVLPGTDLIFGGGKQGLAYLLDRNDMGRFAEGSPTSCPSGFNCACNDPQIVQRFQGTIGAMQSSPVYWNSPAGPLVYLWSVSDVVKAYRLIDGRFETTPFSRGPLPNASFPGGFMSLSANGSAPGTGILWATTANGNANPVTQTGVLRAFDASDLSNELWNSSQNPNFDGMGNLAKFCPPTIANGKVYMASFSNRLHVYGLLPANSPPEVRITAPASQTRFTAPASLTLRADALDRDADDSVKEVAFYAGQTFIGASDTRPYRVSWNDVPSGTYLVTAYATDSRGAFTASGPVEIRVTTEPPTLGGVISISFTGSGTMLMDPYEVAGVVSRSIWNNAPNRDFNPLNTGWLSFVHDDVGRITGAKVAFSANGAFRTPIPDLPGDYRMMKGYLDTSSTTTSYAVVYNLPDSFTRYGYDVYVYLDGDNGGAARSADYSINTTSISATDAGGANFSGTYTEAIAGSDGNYIIFPGLSQDRFILSATPGPSTDATRRAAINGIQVVAHAGP